MRAEHVDQALVLGPVLVEPLELEARGAEGAGRRVLEPTDRRRALAADVDEILGEGADDAVTPGIDFGYVLRVLHRGLDDPARRSVDDGGDAAGLGVERVLPDGLFHDVGGWG